MGNINLENQVIVHATFEDFKNWLKQYLWTNKLLAQGMPVQVINSSDHFHIQYKSPTGGLIGFNVQIIDINTIKLYSFEAIIFSISKNGETSSKLDNSKAINSHFEDLISAIQSHWSDKTKSKKAKILENFNVSLNRNDTYYHLIALCQNDNSFSITDYREDLQENDFERIIISDAKMISKQRSSRGAAIGIIRLLPNGTQTTIMFVDKDAIWNEPISEGGKHLFVQFFQRTKKHFKDLGLINGGSKTPSTDFAPKSKNELRNIEPTTANTSNQDGASKTQITIAIISAIAVVVAACITFMGSVIGALGPKAVDVASTAVVTTPTQRMCNPDSFTPIIATPTPPSLILIVLDTSGEYSNYSIPSIDLISNVLPRVLNAGDKVVIIQMGTGSYTNAVLFERSVQTTINPLIYLPPTQYPTSTPTIPIKITPGSEMQMVAATMTARAQFIAAEATAAEMQFTYNCAFTQYKDYRIQATQYATQLEQTKKDFISDLAVNASTSNVTPIPNQVFESLDVAELVLDNDCSKFSQCKLVIFSDLEEWRTETPDYLSISLRKADILSVMLNCDDLSQSICQTTQVTWTDIFTSLGANTITFTGSRNAETKLIEFLRK